MNRLKSVIALLFLTSGAATANPTTTADPKLLDRYSEEQTRIRPEPDEQPAVDALSGIENARRGADALPVLDRALLLLRRPTKMRGLVQCQRAGSLLELNRKEELNRAIAECDRLLPDNPRIQMLIGQITTFTGDTRRAASRIAFALEVRPDLAPRLEREPVETLLLNLSYLPDAPERQRLLMALRGTSFARERPEQIEMATIDTIADAVKSGDRTKALGLLGDIASVSGGLTLLSDRRFESIWPEIELWAGDLQLLRDVRLNAARAVFEREPSLSNRGRYARVLAASGKREAAIALLGDAIADRASWDEGGYDIGQIADQRASLLLDAGRASESIAMLELLDRSWDGKPFSGLINVLTNRAVAEVWSGQTMAALADISRVQTLARAKSSIDASIEPGALMWFDALHGCALARSDRAQAMATLARFRPVRVTNRQAVDLLSVCLADRDSYRSGLLADLENLHERHSALLLLQPYIARRTGPWEAARQALLSQLRDDPAVRATMLAAGRVLPPVYAPAVKDWRD